MEDFPAIFDQSSGSRRSSPAPVVLRFAYAFPWGKQSLTRLAAFISGHCMFQITITKTYSQGALILWAASGEQVLNLLLMGYHGQKYIYIIVYVTIYIYNFLCNYIYIFNYMHTYVHTLQSIYIYDPHPWLWVFNLHVDEFDHNLASFSVTGMMVKV